MMSRLYFILILILVTGCTTDRPVITPINGHSTVQTTHRFCGIPVWTSEDEARTTDQKRDKIELDRERREVDIDLKTEERQATATFWAGSILFIMALGGVFIGYLTNGWKFWAGFSGLAAVLGMVCWQAEHVVVSPLFKWGGFALFASAIGWTMWKAQHFNIKGYMEKRKQKQQNATGEDND